MSKGEAKFAPSTTTSAGINNLIAFYYKLAHQTLNFNLILQIKLVEIYSHKAFYIFKKNVWRNVISTMIMIFDGKDEKIWLIFHCSSPTPPSSIKYFCTLTPKEQSLKWLFYESGWFIKFSLLSSSSILAPYCCNKIKSHQSLLQKGDINFRPSRWWKIIQFFSYLHYYLLLCVCLWSFLSIFIWQTTFFRHFNGLV